jgi:hypothetical protein
MQRIGAIAIKNTVYALPSTESALEDFQWTLREIGADGGEANLFEARVIEGLSDAEIQQLFNAARDEEYAAIASGARALDGEDRQRLAGDVARLRKRIAEVQSIDFFGAPKGQQAIAILDELVEGSIQRPSREKGIETYRGSVWVTRAGVHVDRMASAWLIRRFIDPDARFKFVAERQYAAKEGEVRFDMFNAEFTHDGDRCTFEALVDRLTLDEPALQAIAEVVHDIDLKEAKFDRPETAGIAVLIASIAMAHRDDDERIARAAAVLEDLYVYYRKKH